MSIFKVNLRQIGWALFLLWSLNACRAEMPAQIREVGSPTVRSDAVVTATLSAASDDGPAQSVTPSVAPSKLTAIPTSTSRPTEPPTFTPTASATAENSPTPVACADRFPNEDDLLTLVTRDFGLSRNYEPGDLVPLSDIFANTITLGYPTEVREVILAPLQEMILAMQAEGLFPQIISGYRSYAAQALAVEKWVERYPDWAHNLTAPPGHSEHQLGTTVDFGSPLLPEIVGEENIQFHPAFAGTGEGRWLAEHSHEYGFTMSYPADSFERTAFYYEPWHFRYVGIELATRLRDLDLTVGEYLLERQPVPCIP